MSDLSAAAGSISEIIISVDFDTDYSFCSFAPPLFPPVKYRTHTHGHLSLN